MRVIQHAAGTLPATLTAPEGLAARLQEAAATLDPARTPDRLRDLHVQEGYRAGLRAAVPEVAELTAEIARRTAETGGCAVAGLPLGSDSLLIALCSFLGPVTPPSHQATDLVEYITPADLRPEADARYFPNQRTALGPHSDSALMPEPHRYLAFATYENTVEAGGHTVLVPAAAIVAGLRAHAGDAAVALLERTPLPFRSRHATDAAPQVTAPVLEGVHTSDVRVRYQGFSLQRVLDGAEPEVPAAVTAAVNGFAAVVSDETAWNVVSVEPGEVLFFDNTRNLHGRTAIAPAARRFIKAFHVGP